MILQPDHCINHFVSTALGQRASPAYLVQDGLDGSGVVRAPVTPRALRLDADELVRGVVRVLRVALRDDAARRVERARWLADSSDVTLDEARGWVRAGVDVALGPRVDRGGATAEEDGTVRDADNGRYVGHPDVVEHDRAVECSVACGGVAQEDRGVRRDCIDDGLSPGALLVDGLASGVEIEPNLTREYVVSIETNM